MVEANCVRDKGTNVSQLMEYTTYSALWLKHTVRDNGTNASRWLMQFTTYWTLWLKHIVYETKGLMLANG